jgi:hypothetical protein
MKLDKIQLVGFRIRRAAVFYEACRIFIVIVDKLIKDLLFVHIGISIVVLKFIMFEC